MLLALMPVCSFLGTYRTSGYPQTLFFSLITPTSPAHSPTWPLLCLPFLLTPRTSRTCLTLSYRHQGPYFTPFFACTPHTQRFSIPWRNPTSAALSLPFSLFLSTAGIWGSCCQESGAPTRSLWSCLAVVGRRDVDSHRPEVCCSALNAGDGTQSLGQLSRHFTTELFPIHQSAHPIIASRIKN